MSFAIPLRFATAAASRTVARAAVPKRLGPNPAVAELRRVAPTIGKWGVMMFGFLTWPTVFIYGFEKTTGV